MAHTVRTLKEFYTLMAGTREVRKQMVQAVFDGAEAGAGQLDALQEALDALRAIPGGEGKGELVVTGDKTMVADMGYEIGELEKDLLYFQEGEEMFFGHLETLHDGFARETARAAEFIGAEPFNCWITDRDGTTNNYCGRYASSVQSAYNALWVSRYARARVTNPIFITSAPLMEPGIVDVSVNPDKVFIYAASKGREFVDLNGARRHYPIDPGKQRLLDGFNDHMEALLEDPQYEVFTLIGSGYQKKFGQTTIARQDITRTVSEEDSLAFLGKIEEVVAHVDTGGGNFHIEDTGLDVEVILTVDGGEGAKDFGKAEGVWFLDETLGLDMARGPHLVSGDTRSDLPLIKAAMARSTDTRAVFVTTDAGLSADVADLCPDSLIVSTPDVLVAAVGLIGNQ